MDSRVSRGEWWDAMEAGHRRARKARQIVCVCARVFFHMGFKGGQKESHNFGASPLLWRTPEQMDMTPQDLS